MTPQDASVRSAGPVPAAYIPPAYVIDLPLVIEVFVMLILLCVVKVDWMYIKLAV